MQLTCGDAEDLGQREHETRNRDEFHSPRKRRLLVVGRTRPIADVLSLCASVCRHLESQGSWSLLMSARLYDLVGGSGDVHQVVSI